MEQDKGEVVKKLNELEKELPGYTDPWGFLGGLFSSFLSVMVLVAGYSMDNFNEVDIMIVSVLILSNGYLHSRTMVNLNKEAVLSTVNLNLTSATVATMSAMGEVIAKQEKEIKKLKETQGVSGVEKHGG